MKILSIFVASPSDVNEERKALDSLISELNRTWSKNLGINLELLKWETDTRPNFGAYPQDVINEQIGDDYDIFLGIFWSRIGSPTDKYDSGTLEEFNRAYNRWKIAPNTIDIMLYFKDEPIHPSKIDIEQLSKLQKLKSDIGPMGGAYYIFNSLEDFISKTRAHLSQTAQEWSKRLSAKNTELIITNPIEILNSDEEEYGLLDYQDIFDDRMALMTDALIEISKATERVGAQFSKRADSLNDLHRTESATRVETKKIIKLTCDDLDNYSEIIESKLNLLENSRKEAFDALSKAISLSVDFNNSGEEHQLSSLQSEMKSLTITGTQSLSQLSLFLGTIEDLPRLSVNLNKAKRRASKALSIFLEECTLTIESAKDVVKTIEKL